MKSKILKLLGVVATVAILASMIVAPVVAVTSVTATLDTVGTSDEISKAGHYTVIFTLGQQIVAGDTITITFPSTYTVPAAVPGTAITASPGWVGGAWTNAVVAGTTFAGSAAAFTVTATLAGADAIGQSASVRIDIPAGAGVINPPTAGDFTLTVKTSKETTAVTSNAFTVVNPTVAPIPGVASVYNSAGILLFQSTDFATALPTVTTGGTIKLTAGTYNTAFPGSAISFTVLGMGAGPGDVVLKSTAAWALTGATVVFDNVTIDGTTAALSLNATTAGTIKNSVLKGGVVNLGGLANTIDTCSVTVLTGLNGINATTATTVKGSTFSVAGTGSAGITASANLTVTGSTFTGATGATTAAGVVLTGGTASSIGTSTFTALPVALSVTGATVSFNGNTVDACGVTAGADVITVVSTTGLAVTNNKITNSKDYIVSVGAAGNDEFVVVMFNEFSGNVKAIENLDAVAPTAALNATHNYWGGAATPASTATVSYANALNKKGTSGAFVAVAVAATLALDSSTTTGVNIVSATTSTLIGSANYAENPALSAAGTAIALPAGTTLKRYYDVFGVGTGAATIRFYGETGKAVAAGDAIYFYNSSFGRWDLAAQTINVFGGYIEVTVGTAPTAAQFVGLPFALVTVPPAPPAAPNLAIGSGAVPALGATGVAVDTTLAWPAVAGATSYDIVIAEDSTLADKFAVINYSATSPIAMHKIPADQILKYDQIYWWRVRSVSAAGASAWTISSFTTEKEPAAVVDPTTTVVTTTVPVVTSVPAPVITVQIPTSEPVNVIPPYLLWAVVAVGIILVIAVVVLIVRTRRIS